MMMSARMDYTTVAYMQIVQIQMEVLSVLAIMDFLETGRLALVSDRTMTCTSASGTDPEIWCGRWLMGWLPIVNYILVQEGWLVNNGRCLLYHPTY